jgi:peptidyl-prolyl cis-trans isomerase D
MLQSMRSKIKGLVAFFLIALLSIPLALVGVESLFYGNNNVGEAAEVNGRMISEREVQIALGRERQRLQAQLGDSLPAEFLSDERLRGPVIEGLIQRSLIANTAEDGKMTFSTQSIDESIVKLPDFQVDGKFDGQRFVQVVRSIGHSPASFRELLKEDMLVSQMQNAVVSTDFITEDEIQRAIALSRQTRDFSWLTLPIGNRTDAIVVSDEEIAAYYEAHKQDFLSEEQVAIEYIELSVGAIQKEVNVDEEKIRQQYEQIVKNYTATTQREAAHIMIEGDTDEAQQKIADVKEKLAAGDDFGAIAKAYSDDFGSRDNGGNLGLSTGDGFPEAFEKALLNLTVGSVSEPIKIDGATHFIKLINLIEKAAPSYEQQKPIITAELSRIKAEEQFVQDVQALEDLVYNAATLVDVGKQLALPVNKTALFTRQGAKEPILQDSRVIDAAFSEQVLQEGHSSNVLELSTDKVVVVKLIEHKPVRTLSLDEKKVAIIDELKLEKAKAQIALEASLLREALDNGTDITVLAEEKNIALSSQVAAQRNAAEVPSELLASVFEMPAPEAEKVLILERHLDNGDYVIASLSKVTDGSLTDLSDTERLSLRNNLSSSIVGDEYRAWQNVLRKQASIEVYRSRSSDQ